VVKKILVLNLRCCCRALRAVCCGPALSCSPRAQATPCAADHCRAHRRVPQYECYLTLRDVLACACAAAVSVRACLTALHLVQTLTMTIYATRHARGLAKNGQSQRYTGDERQSLLMWTLRRLEPLELQALHVSRKAADAAAVPGSKPAKLAWPNKFRMSEIFNEMPPCELGGNEQLPEEGTKEWWNLRRNRMLAAKRVVEDFLRYQSYQPRASVQKGRFNWWREEKLVRMFKIIEMGVIEVDGVDTAAANLPAEGRPPMDRIFYDIWEARALSPQFAADAEALRYNPNKELSDRRIYELLQERNPTLYRGLLTNKMQRDNGMVRTFVVPVLVLLSVSSVLQIVAMQCVCVCMQMSQAQELTSTQLMPQCARAGCTLREERPGPRAAHRACLLPRECMAWSGSN
jgi:hypothetical protein